MRGRYRIVENVAHILLVIAQLDVGKLLAPF
jgi:hypothetical protein